MNNNFKFIHLLYVPTMNCNMQCKYCYLKENTVALKGDDKYLKTLKYAVDNCNNDPELSTSLAYAHITEN